MNLGVRPTWRQWIVIIAWLAMASTDRVVTAADQARINAAIQRGQQFIIKNKLAGPTGSIAALGYIKSGGDKHHPSIVAIVEEILSKTQSGFYKPILHHVYEGAVDMMILEAIDREVYRPQLEIIANFIRAGQLENGAWFYDHNLEPDCGDTSITQYAMLGLWTAARNGITVPVEVWEKAAKWHLAHQKEDGGFAYHPFEGKISNVLEHKVTQATMTVAGSSSLLIIRRVLFEDADHDSEVRPTETKRRFGVLEKFVEEKAAPKPTTQNRPTMKVSTIDKALKDSMKVTANTYIDKRPHTETFFYYYMYSIERVAALLDVKTLGDKDWYDFGSEEILKRQAADGSWNDSTGQLVATSFALMFLSKATMTVIAPKKKITLLGGGLQTGGRGLPDNLGAVQVKDGVVSSRKIVGQVDNLLIELERSADAKVLEAQAAVVESIQLDQPEDLIGQVDRLRKLANDPRGEVRRTAVWALARSGDISTAKLLINALMDPDASVVREASLGLTILSRRPEGCGLPIDPGDDTQMGIKDEATEDERKAVVSKWQRDSKKRWTDWYMKTRPYDERDDRTMLRDAGR